MVFQEQNVQQFTKTRSGFKTGGSYMDCKCLYYLQLTPYIVPNVFPGTISNPDPEYYNKEVKRLKV